MAVLESTRFCWSSEDDLQRGLASAFTNAGLAVQREVRVDAHNRLDLVVGRVGIEVKIAGAWRDVLRQVVRYCTLDLIDALVLVTTRADHRRVFESSNGKPIILHYPGSTL